jgi:hypothetical protein
VTRKRRATLGWVAARRAVMRGAPGSACAAAPQRAVMCGVHPQRPEGHADPAPTRCGNPHRAERGAYPALTLARKPHRTVRGAKSAPAARGLPLRAKCESDSIATRNLGPNGTVGRAYALLAGCAQSQRPIGVADSLLACCAQSQRTICTAYPPTASFLYLHRAKRGADAAIAAHRSLRGRHALRRGSCRGAHWHDRCADRGGGQEAGQTVVTV